MSFYTPMGPRRELKSFGMGILPAPVRRGPTVLPVTPIARRPGTLDVIRAPGGHGFLTPVLLAPAPTAGPPAPSTTPTTTAPTPFRGPGGATFQPVPVGVGPVPAGPVPSGMVPPGTPTTTAASDTAAAGSVPPGFTVLQPTSPTATPVPTGTDYTPWLIGLGALAFVMFGMKRGRS